MAIVEIELIALAVRRLRVKLVNVLVDMAIGHVEIGIAVVVGIEEVDAKGQPVQAVGGDTRSQRFVGEHPITRVVVQGVALPLEIGHRQVETTIAIAVGHIHAHCPLGLAADVVRHASHQPHFGKATAVVAPEKIRRGVVALKQIGIAVEVVVEKHRAQFAAFVREQSNRVCHVHKATAVVAPERVPLPSVFGGGQVPPRPAQRSPLTQLAALKFVVQVIRHVQV